jgi:tetratricopeptide (TPR) repeat protein
MQKDSMILRFSARICAGKWRCVLVVLAFGLLAIGCSQTSSTDDAQHENNPYFQKAKQANEAQDYQTAAGLYEKALETDPLSAPAHLELGLLYDEKLADPIAAIYHYRKYLELQPNSDKQQLVEQFIERAKLTLAAKLPQATVDPQELGRLQSENAALMQDNMTLKAKVAELEQAQAAQPSTPVTVAPAPVVVPTAQVPATITAALPPASRTYVVQKGDTLQSLALRFYGTRSGWEKIYDANRGCLASKDQLKIGQSLTIP